jgi:hypothetical protein
MVPRFQTWETLLCPDGAECTIEAAIYYTIYCNIDTKEIENNLDLYMTQIQAQWIRPDIIEIDGKQRNIQGYLEKKGRTDPMAKIMAKNYQTFANMTQQAKTLYEDNVRLYQTALLARQDEYDAGRLPNFSEILGMYEIDFSFKVGRELYLYITDDPPELLFKSQGRPWEGNSCERFTGPYNRGYITDITYGNLAAYIVDRHGMPIARKMIRWGLGDNEDGEEIYALCLEPPWYYDTLPIHPFEIDEFKQNLDEQLWTLIRENGYYADQATTPYFYEGFSDTINGKGRITYENNDGDEAEEPYMVFQSDVGDSKIIYVAEMTARQRREYFENDYEYMAEDDMYYYYLTEKDENVQMIHNMDLFYEYLSHILATTNYNTHPLLWNEEGQEWLVDTEGKWYDIHMEEESKRELTMAQAHQIFNHFRTIGIVEDEDYKFRAWLIAVIMQYGKIFSYLNFNAGLFSERFGGEKSFVGNMTGRTLFYFKDVGTLFTENDRSIKASVIAQIQAGEIE